MMVLGYRKRKIYQTEKKNKIGIMAAVFSSLAVAGFLLFFVLNWPLGKGGDGMSKKNSEVAVATENQNNINKENNRELEASSLTFEELIFEQPDAPVKVMGVGNFYARAKSAIAIDANTHTILHYQDGKKRTAIASLTKIMTAVLTVESIENLENEYVTISEEAVYVDGTKVGCPRSDYCISDRLQIGEKISAQSLLEAMLMNSANDAAAALAIHISGSEKEFAKKMNEKARELGLVDTNFCNPSGLDEEENPGGCYSSAYDIARIAAYSLQYDRIWEIMKIKDKEIYSKDGKISHRIINTDILIDQIPNCLGGKTGFTYEAGKSLMMAAYHPNNPKYRIVAVLLDDYYRWEDMKDLISWSFQAYNWPEKIVYEQ